MTARHELDHMCREVRNELAHGLKATGNSMGRIGLSCARRHPALLLGGGALLGFGAVTFLTRGRRHAHAHHEETAAQHADGQSSEPSPEAHDHKAKKPSKSTRFATGAALRILKTAARMWLLEHLSSQVRAEEESEADPSDHHVAAETAV